MRKSWRIQTRRTEKIIKINESFTPKLGQIWRSFADILIGAANEEVQHLKRCESEKVCEGVAISPALFRGVSWISKIISENFPPEPADMNLIGLRTYRAN